MSKRLELLFSNMEGRSVTLAVEDPIEPANAELINEVMDEILNENIFMSTGGPLVSKRGARIVERTVEQIDIDTEE
ncbi:MULTISPECIES: DUF2922 domain-containing protein [Alteribacter]|uniref:DUF2922 domain-containing protein n=1 Tax=Alteribacter keqinensis TaxID=2483800 RepID=A0A3M7TYY1_9BACI|nr:MULTISPECIES: DUF2922 domain-containing protein [Alteribacter]MBM7097675.1 DUF2922 domain-containing protein [Alteribacter salitolerans]RNA70112.1 DUF2922 domain-containing protein [Alteribacter keqinensis]